MIGDNTPLAARLETWSATFFVAGGGLFLVATAINGLGLFTSVATQQGILQSIEGMSGFGGVVLTFLGLLGLYPRLARRTPRLARAGVSLAVLPATFFLVLLVVCSALAPFLGFPSLKTLVPSFHFIFETIVFLFAVSLTLFGVASLAPGRASRIVGALFFVVAGGWFVFFGALEVYHYDIPIWVTFVQTTMMAVPLGTIGYFLQSGTELAGTTELSADPSVTSSETMQ